MHHQNRMCNRGPACFATDDDEDEGRRRRIAQKHPNNCTFATHVAPLLLCRIDAARAPLFFVWFGHRSATLRRFCPWPGRPNGTWRTRLSDPPFDLSVVCRSTSAGSLRVTQQLANCVYVSCTTLVSVRTSKCANFSNYDNFC